jgi:hypothetical protein
VQTQLVRGGCYTDSLNQRQCLVSVFLGVTLPSGLARYRLLCNGSPLSRSLVTRLTACPSVLGRINQAKAGTENALRAKPEDVREQYERQVKHLQEAYGEAMLELRARKKLESLLGKDES